MTNLIDRVLGVVRVRPHTCKVGMSLLCPSWGQYPHKMSSTYKYTDAQISLHTLLVKYYNDLIGRQSSE